MSQSCARSPLRPHPHSPPCLLTSLNKLKTLKSAFSNHNSSKSSTLLPLSLRTPDQSIRQVITTSECLSHPKINATSCQHPQLTKCNSASTAFKTNLLTHKWWIPSKNHIMSKNKILHRVSVPPRPKESFNQSWRIVLKITNKATWRKVSTILEFTRWLAKSPKTLPKWRKKALITKLKRNKCIQERPWCPNRSLNSYRIRRLLSALRIGIPKAWKSSCATLSKI